MPIFNKGKTGDDAQSVFGWWDDLRKGKNKKPDTDDKAPDTAPDTDQKKPGTEEESLVAPSPELTAPEQKGLEAAGLDPEALEAEGERTIEPLAAPSLDGPAETPIPPQTAQTPSLDASEPLSPPAIERAEAQDATESPTPPGSPQMPAAPPSAPTPGSSDGRQAAMEVDEAPDGALIPDPEPLPAKDLPAGTVDPVDPVDPDNGRVSEPSHDAMDEVAADAVPTDQVPTDEAPGADTPPEEQKTGFFGRLRKGLSRTSSNLGQGITSIFTKAKLDDETLEDLEDLLITADLGIETSTAITTKLAKQKYDKEISPDEVRAALAAEIALLLEPVAVPLAVDPAHAPHVILMVGVNGTGKTTTIGKLAERFRREGRSVMLAAGDTFRAAAINQLKVWGERAQVPVIAKEQGADAAGLAFEALERAKADGIDVLLIDTAGRLQNKAGLMAELEKILRVIRKVDPAAPHSVIQVLDATTGQNAISQVDAFIEKAEVSGLMMTKLDGTARGGILVALAAKFDLPIHAIGVGEGLEDFQAFDPHDFAKALVGAEETAAGETAGFN